MITGKPQHWMGRSVTELRTSLGEPTRVIPQENGELWEYKETGEFVAPARDSTSFRAGGYAGGPAFGMSGNTTTVRQGERLSQYENVTRFLIRDGKVRRWSAARIVDGETVWSDH